MVFMTWSVPDILKYAKGCEVKRTTHMHIRGRHTRGYWTKNLSTGQQKRYVFSLNSFIISWSKYLMYYKHMPKPAAKVLIM